MDLRGHWGPVVVEGVSGGQQRCRGSQGCIGAGREYRGEGQSEM